MNVALTYFKQTGKYYAEAGYESSCKYDFEIYREVREMMDNGSLPGLTAGHSEFIVVVMPSNSTPALLIP